MPNIDMAAFGLTERYTPFLCGDRMIGRIVCREKGLYRVVNETGEQVAEISGRFRYKTVDQSDFPTVGDFVLTNIGSAHEHAVIYSVLPRKSVFVRKAAGTNVREQLIAANIDTVFICMSLNADFNIRRLERYLSTVWDGGAVPVTVLTKSDLCQNTEPFLGAVRDVAFGSDIVVVSAKDENVNKKLLPYIGYGKTVAFAGSSGVGKSTLINALLGEERLRTNGLRNDDKGRHTTTKRELFLLDCGGSVIDTPGIRELGMWASEDGIEKTFSDIDSFASMCRFNNCTHTSEPGCAVLKAISEGVLDEKRLLSYRKLKNENMYTENTDDYLAEKKKKFKNIAKINRKSR